MKKRSITEQMHYLFNGKRVEPIKRFMGGRYGWAIHRFPIKGGISIRDAMMIDSYRSVWKDFIEKKD